jgi:tetratricopeptide (TPR) repeat protein
VQIFARRTYIGDSNTRLQDMDIGRDTSRFVMRVATSALTLMLAATWAAAQSPNLSNIDLCNGRDRTSAEPQIIGCTALIKSDVNNSHILAIAHNNRGDAYVGKGEYDLAIQDYDESIKLDANFAKPFNNRGFAYQAKGDYERAIQDFGAAINIDPKYANAFANRAETYQKTGDYPNALKDFDEAIRLQPTLKVLWNERCWTHAVVGELQAAITDCNEAIRLDPKVATAFDSRGFTYLKLGQWEQAIVDYDSALRIDPKSPTALYGRGFAKLKTGDRAGGSTDIMAAKSFFQGIAEQFARFGLQ